MTVGELRAALEHFPPDAVVRVFEARPCHQYSEAVLESADLWLEDDGGLTLNLTRGELRAAGFDGLW